MIAVGVEVRRYDDAITKLASGECLLCMLAIQNGIELNKNLTTSWHVDACDKKGSCLDEEVTGDCSNTYLQWVVESQSIGQRHTCYIPL